MSTTEKLLIPLLDDKSDAPHVAWFKGMSNVEKGMLGAKSYSLSAGNATANDEDSRTAIFILTGTLTANRTLTLPAGADHARPHIVINKTTGSFEASVKTAGQSTSIMIPQGSAMQLYNDGINTMDMSGEPGTFSDGISIISYSDSDSTRARVRLYSAEGVPGAPTAITSGKDIGAIPVHGHDGSGFGVTGLARIVSRATEDLTPTAHGSEWILEMCYNGTIVDTIGLHIRQSGVYLHKGLVLKEQAVLPTPSSGEAVIGVDTSGNAYVKNDDGVIRQLGSRDSEYRQLTASDSGLSTDNRVVFKSASGVTYTLLAASAMAAAGAYQEVNVCNIGAGAVSVSITGGATFSDGVLTSFSIPKGGSRKFWIVPDGAGWLWHTK